MRRVPDNDFKCDLLLETFDEPFTTNMLAYLAIFSKSRSAGYTSSKPIRTGHFGKLTALGMSSYVSKVNLSRAFHDLTKITPAPMVEASGVLKQLRLLPPSKLEW